MLQKELHATRKAAFAEGTTKNLWWQWKLFIMFCTYFSFNPLPATIECLCLYAQFLSRSFKSVSSICNYISGVRTLHVLLDSPYEADNSVELKMTLRGLRRTKPHKVRQAAPLCPRLLARIYVNIVFQDPVQATLWALILLAFFTLARKSNLVVTGKQKFDKDKQLCRSDVILGKQGMLVQFKWSKTNQFGLRCHLVPIMSIPDSPLCPVRAYKNMIKLVPGSPSDPAFMSTSAQPIKYSVLQSFIKGNVKRLGLDPSAFSSHSLRRAGATWAFKSQVPGELIQIHGDWASQAYLRYLEFSMSQKLQVADKMTTEIMKLNR